MEQWWQEKRKKRRTKNSNDNKTISFQLRATWEKHMKFFGTDETRLLLSLKQMWNILFIRNVDMQLSKWIVGKLRFKWNFVIYFFYLSIFFHFVEVKKTLRNAFTFFSQPFYHFSLWIRWKFRVCNSIKRKKKIICTYFWLFGFLWLYYKSAHIFQTFASSFSTISHETLLNKRTLLGATKKYPTISVEIISPVKSFLFFFFICDLIPLAILMFHWVIFCHVIFFSSPSSNSFTS